MPADELQQLAAERGLGLRLLIDATPTYASVCGVRFEMTEGGIELYSRPAARFGLKIPRLEAASGWELPIPATYVAGRDGVIRYAFGDAVWSRPASPADIVNDVERLAQATGTAARASDRGLSARSTNALTGGE